MSLDLFKEDIGGRMASFATIQAPEPGVWDGFARGTGMAAMRNLAKAGRAVDLLGAIGPMAQDALGLGVERGGTTAQDRYFREHDELFNSAVDYWTPRPGEVGAAAEITGSLLTLLPMVVASPAFAVGSSVLMTGEDLVREGVRGKEAAVAGTLMGAGLATGIWMPILGQNLWQRMLIGGAAANVAQGAATRGAIGTFLESGDATEAEKKAAQGFKAFDPVELTTDVLLGLAFGSFVHLNPRARAEGAEAWKRIGDWAQALKPSDKAAVAVLREAQHLNKDSFPGTPVGAEDVNAHVERMRRAIDQAERGQPIAVDDLPAPRAEPDTQRNAEAQARMAEMLVEAEAIREAEGLPPAPLPDLPPTRPVLERTPEGAPRLVTDRVVLDEPRPFQTVGNEAYYEATVRSPEGNPLGVVALGWRGDEVVELLNIQAIDQNRGMGAAVLSGILRNNAPDTEVWIRLIQPEARGFWEKVGARLFDTEEGTDGAITKAEFDTARANRAAEKEAGRAGAADAADAGAGARAEGAPGKADKPVELGRPSAVVSPRGETKTVTYEHLPDGRLQRTIKYDDGETVVEILHTDRLGDEQWVSSQQYGRGEYYPVQMSDEAARAKAAEDLADLGTPARQPTDQAQVASAATTEPPRTRIEVPADLAAADPETQARAIGQSIEDRLLELGVDAEEARANGAIWEAFFRTLSQKYGVNPGETLASYGIDIRRLDTIADLPGALAQAKALVPDDYGMTHRPPRPQDGAPGHNLADTFPDDIYGPDGARYYGHFGGDAMDAASVSIIKAMRNRPDAEVTIYRAVPKIENETEELARLEREMAKFLARRILPKGMGGKTGFEGETEWYDAAVNRRDELRAKREAGTLEKTPRTVINSGDWVTINRQYAAQHGQSNLNGNYRIMSKKVKAKEIFTDGNSIHEWGYWKDGVAADDSATKPLPPSIEVDGVQRTTLNSEGRQIAGTEEGVRNFWRWFGDSKVVDDQGRPLVVYHGTGADFFEFRTTTVGEFGPAIYMTDSPREAAEYGNELKGVSLGQPSASVMPVYARMLNPYKNTAEEFWKQFGADDSDANGIQRAKDAGYDGVISQRPDRYYDNAAREFVDRGEMLTHYVAFNPAQIKSAIGNEGTFDPANPNILRQTATPSQSWYYSAIGQAIEKANMNAAPAKGWKDMIKGLTQKGVKPDEIKWSGIEEWLDLQQGRVSKEAVLDYLRNNGVRVEEVVLGQYANDYEAFVTKMERKYGAGYEWEMLTAAEQAEQMRLWDSANQTGGMNALATKYQQYQLPGALPGTYRELLLTLPGEGAGRLDNERAYSQRVQEIVAARDTGIITNDEAEAAFAQARQENRINEFGRSADVFRSSHFDATNILAHVRFNERIDADGQRVLFIEEIQSDWAQKGKKDGFATEIRERRLPPDMLVRRALPEDEELYGIETESWALFQGEDQELVVPVGPASLTREQAMTAAFESADAAGVRLEDFGGVSAGVPRAPFVEKTEQWVALVLKRMIRYAAENGINRIAWTRGEQQVDRYTSALRKAVDTIEWTKTAEGVQLVGYKGSNDADRQSIQGLRSDVDDILDVHDNLGFDTRAEARQAILANADWENRWGDGITEPSRRQINNWRRIALNGPPRTKVVDTTEREDALSDSIGKALAKQILDDPNQSGTITGDNIRIDDTGMAQFYDRIVPNVAKDVLKKLGGGKVTDTSIDVQGRTDSQPAIDLPPEMLDKALQGQTLFQRGSDARQTEAVGNAVKAAQRWETERIDALRQTLFDELADQGTVQGRVVDMEGLPRDEAGDLTPEGEAEASRRERAAIDAAAEATPRIATLDDVDSYGTPTQARDAAKAYLDSIGAAYSEDGGWGTSLYIEVRPPEGSVAEDEGLTLKLRFSNHENQSRMHTPTEHNWVEGSVPSGMLQAMLDAARRFAETGEGGDLFFQTGAPYTQPERGVIHFGNGQTMIGLMATANRSTFLHESGHLFLQITRDVVQNPEIPAQARADWDRLSAWLGIEPDTTTIPVEAHEKFTRGFEAYLREGKAPNQGLQDVFRRFRDWLLDIYHSVADLRVELSDDVRGIMARMLDSQARDPINAKGPAESAPRVSPPPPPGEGGEATPRPEAPPTPEGARTPGALEGPDPWDVEGSIPAQGPDVPFEPVGLDNPDMRTMLQIMADEEAGWLEIGGRLDRSRLTDPEKLGTPAFTKWVPKADWWPQREGKLNEAQTREAVRRALAGEKLTKKQQAAIDYMMDVANQRLHAEKVLGSDEFGALARDLVDEGLDPTTQDINEVAMIARAAEIDEARVERAAMIHEGNHDAFLEEIRTLLDEAAEREAGAPEPQPAGRPGQEGAGAQGREGGEGEGRPDPVAAAAQRFVDQNPGRPIQVVDDAGNTRTMTAAEYLQEARDQAAAAREDMGLFQAAAECLLGGGR